MNAATRWKLFCAVSPGLEPLLEAEIKTIAEAKAVRSVRGGCVVHVSPTGVWAVVLRSRITESARVRIGAFEARTFDELHAGIRKLPWAAWLPRGSTPEVRVTCRKSKLWHSGAVEERVQQQVRARLAWKKDTPAADKPGAGAARVFVRIDHDAVRVSVDASGELLHRRGERTAIGKAPMRETLAAAIVRAAAPAPQRAIWDPFCGAGTILLEAGRAAVGGVQARDCGYAFELWPSHDADAFDAWVAASAPRTGEAPRLLGCDLAAKEIDGASDNLAAAGLAASLRACDFADMADEVPLGAVVISNLPYGRRADVGDIFRRLGRLLAKRRDLDVWLLLGHASHAEQLRIPARAVINLRNGGLRVGLYHRPPSDRPAT